MNNASDPDIAKELLTVIDSLAVTIAQDKEAKRSLSYLTASEPGVKRKNAVKPKDASPALSLEDIRRDMENCQRCPLHEGRKNVVFGSGNPQASLVFIGEAPGADEDQQGLPFVGRAGQLLTKIIEAMGFKREDVYIANILKCRPPNNRNPRPAEIQVCEPFLVQQLKAISPKIICALGTFAAQTLLKREVPITVLRGKFYDYHDIALMPTYHPAYLLRNPSAKRQVWEDVQQIMTRLQTRSGENEAD
ncbi:MAG: uracil-DNA glycosylase [Syntrophobacterales bacterium]|jgi:DNA polymerase|nr:uracil-DNA glycosylase [Syntrophobacterales bacterium]